jgi:nucleotide-binding universal stress UspA family protein
MTILCRILVPKDSSPGSDGALEYAWLLARRVQGAIDVLHIRDTSEDSGSPLTSLGNVAMQGALEERRPFGGVEVRARVEVGDPYATIVRVATSERFDLVVLGQSDPASVPNSESESIARRVAHSVRCPVIKVRPALQRRVGA